MESHKSLDNNESGYQPEICNIGEEEVKQRRNFAIKTIVFCFMFIVLFELFELPKFLRLLFFLPAVGFAVSMQQWLLKFCVAFGIKGLFNFGEVGTVTKVKNPEYVRKDRKKSWKMIITGIIFGAISTLIYYLIP